MEDWLSQLWAVRRSSSWPQASAGTSGARARIALGDDGNGYKRWERLGVPEPAWSAASYSLSMASIDGPRARARMPGNHVLKGCARRRRRGGGLRRDRSGHDRLCLLALGVEHRRAHGQWLGETEGDCGRPVGQG